MESKVLDNYGRVVCTLTPLDGICILAASQIEEDLQEFFLSLHKT